MADRAHEYALARYLCAHRGGPLDSSRRSRIDRLDIFAQPQVRLPQCLVDATVWFAVRAVQRVFLAGDGLGAFGGPGAAGFSHDGGRFQIHGSVAGRVGDDVRGKHAADLAARDATTAYADMRVGTADSLCAHSRIV